MREELYSVTRDEYVGFVDQIKPESRLVETYELEDYKVIKISSMETGVHFCSRFIPLDENSNEPEHYYVFNMPANNERRAPRPVQKITLESAEEVETFFNLLGKAQRGELNDRTIQ